jgi:hypothetical protein
VTVGYNLTGVSGLNNPQLVVSSVDHWTPDGGGDVFHEQYTVPLTSTQGTVTIPASAFSAGGAGLYGVGIIQNQFTLPYVGRISIYGEFRALTVGASASQRPSAAPAIAGPGQSSTYATEVQQSDPNLSVKWNVNNVSGADGAAVEISSPAPTLYNSLNTFTNQFGSQRDDDGVDHGSTLYQALPSAAGSTVLNLDKLGVPDSMLYSVRVLPTRNGKPIGQASPSSFLEFDDAQQLTSGNIEDFDIVGGTALLSTTTFGTSTNPLGLADASIQRYDLSTGTFGKPLMDDTTGADIYDVIGSDPTLGVTVAVTDPYSDPNGPKVVEYDTATGGVVASAPLPNDSPDTYFQSGTVDAKRGRAAIITYNASTGLDQLWPFSLNPGSFQGPLTLNGSDPGFAYTAITIDESNGDVYAGPGGSLGACLDGVVNYEIVKADFDTGTVSAPTSLPDCTAGFAADGNGGSVYVVSGPITPDPESNALPTATLSTLDQSSLTTTGASVGLGTAGPAWPVVDSRNGVLLVASLFEQNAGEDNNAMSEVDVVDLATGKVVDRQADFNFVNSTLADENLEFSGMQGIQLNPATRTAYVVGPYADQLERFTY